MNGIDAKGQCIRQQVAQGMTAQQPSLRQRLGCWCHERWRTELVVRVPWLARGLGLSWLDLCNRAERLRAEPGSIGRVCGWQDSSRLTVARIFPQVGLRLLRRVLREWPVRLAGEADVVASEHPQVTIVIPIGGTERMQQFDLALASARAQTGVATEILVVEQSPEPTLEGRLPPDVRYRHDRVDAGSAGFNKSRALNLGARCARGESLLLMDADFLLPERFACECHQALVTFEGVRPMRLLFYLDAPSLPAIHRSRRLEAAVGVDDIVENNPTPIAVRKATYWAIGGHDEDYAGWGGEDTEFLDRLRTRRISEAGWLPLVHVWHAAAPKKASGDRNHRLHEAKMRTSSATRIQELRARAERLTQ